MHMWIWFGYDLGEFMFSGLNVTTKPGLAITCVVLFVISFLFEASKVYVARTQRQAKRRLTPHRRNDERRNLLWDTAPEFREAGPSQSSRRVHHVEPVSTKRKILINLYQTWMFLLHNVVGYLLMLAVMVYNVYVMAAVVLGMIAGYYVFGPMLTRLQMECFAAEDSHCTQKCDDNAEGTTPPLLHSSLSSESDFLTCQTPSCSRPGDSTPTSSIQSQVPGRRSCYYGAKSCPSKAAVVARLQNKAATSHCHREIVESKDDLSKSIEDAMLLREDSRGCCPSTPPTVALDPVVRIVTPNVSSCAIDNHTTGAEDEGQASENPEDSTDRQTQNSPTPSPQPKHKDRPQISCCHSNMKSSDSQQNML